MAMDPDEKKHWIERMLNAQFFVYALLVHVIAFILLAGTVIIRALVPTKSFISTTLIAGEGLGEAPPPPPPAPTETKQFDVQVNQNPMDLKVREIIASSAPSASFSLPQFIAPTPTPGAASTASSAAQNIAQNTVGTFSREQLKSIKDFTKNWVKSGGSGGPRGIVAEFPIYVGQLSSGKDSLANIALKDGTTDTIIGGAIPNLSEMINRFSKGRIRANLQGKILRLASNEIFDTKPPFIYITGRRDFKLTDQEVENLRKYLITGGCIWGDNALPGRRSPFDIAFRREMKRVIPDADKPFIPIPPDHPIYTKGFFKLDQVPTGLNFNRELIEAIKIDDIEVVVYSMNGYGTMWQVMPTEDEKDIDRELLAWGHHWMYDRRDILFRNVDPKALGETYKVGINIVAYLLLRYETKLRSISL